MLLACLGIKKFPPYRIPESMRQRFTLGGMVEVLSGYCDDCRNESTHYSKPVI
ncbi:MAG: hypothetical protein OEN02_00720 [Gammaproteobacteria bacterium]|nr:hypothetical protein [Gammaproteobacteria bacterium]MDH3535429.1 hypothetical protein [Gammaproteobacteria bacterium]